MLEINKKQDIVIPFKEISQDNWDIKTRLILQSFAQNWDSEIAQAISLEEIQELENRLGTTLPKGLKTFYLTFGLADMQEQLQSFDEIGWLKDIWAEYPEYGPNFSEQDKIYLPYLVSFSDSLGSGNMFCFHSQTKQIYFFNHDTRPYITKMFDTADQYIKASLIFAQADLFAEAEQEDVEKWTQEVVSELYGADIVQRWQY